MGAGDQRFVGIDLGFVGIIGYFAGRSPPTEFDLPANIYDGATPLSLVLRVSNSIAEHSLIATGLVEKPTGPRAVTPMVSALLGECKQFYCAHFSHVRNQL